jgi:dolichol-phosphate mannosyltransferase
MTNEDLQVVYGQRLTREGETWLKKVTASGFYRVLDWLTDVQIPVDTGDFRLMDRAVVDVINSLPEQDRFMRGLVSWVGFRQAPYHYHRDSRFAGVTKFNYRRMILFAIDGITSFSIKPLRLALLIGVFLIGVCVLASGWAVYEWYNNAVIPGWASVFIAQLLIGSLQLFVMGVIGEYVGRSFLQGKGRPIYIVAKSVGRSE